MNIRKSCRLLLLALWVSAPLALFETPTVTAMPRSVEVQKQTLRWRKVLPLVAVTLIPGSTDENTWVDPTGIPNAGPGEHAASDETASIQIVDVDRRPIHGSYTISVHASHVSGMTRVRGILDNGTSVYQTTPVAGFDTSDFNAAVLSRWQNRVYTFTFNTADITFSASTRLCKVWFCTDAVDGQNRQVSIEFVAHQNAIAPTETKYVSLTTNSPSNGNDGSSAHPWATLDYALVHVADGGTIKCVDAGNYTITRAASFRANERYITITTDLAQSAVQIRGDGGDLAPKVQWLSFSGVTFYISSWGHFDAAVGGNCKIWLNDVLVTSIGWQYYTTGPGNHEWIALGQNDYWWFTDCVGYDTVWGLVAQNSKYINCIIDKLSGVPISGTPDLVFNVVVSNFNADYLDDSPDPVPVDPFHRDVCHYGYHGVARTVTYGLRTADDVSATMFRIEALHGPDGYFTDMLWQNCEMDGVDDATTQTVFSDQNGLHTNVVWDNVWNPHNPWDFVNSEPTKPNFSASNVYMIRCGFHWRNFVSWVLPLYGPSTGSPLPSGVTLVDCYEPAEGLQDDVCPMTAGDEPTGLRFTWTASGWTERSSGIFYIYNTLTQEIAFEYDFLPVSGNILWTDAEYGVPYAGLVIELNDGTGARKYGQAPIVIHYAPPILGTDGEGFTQKIPVIAGAVRYTWTPTNSQSAVTTGYDGGDDEVGSSSALFEEAP